jgi:hypothetical protein
VTIPALRSRRSAVIDPHHLSVIGRTSMMAYKRPTKSLAEIGRELDAAYLVESSVRAEGGWAGAHLSNLELSCQEKSEFVSLLNL